MLSVLVYSIIYFLLFTRKANAAWGKCDGEMAEIAPSLECDNLNVPSDYAHESSDEITLHLARLPALKEKKGTIYINFGGPGLPGRPSLAQAGSIMQL
jgi:hypothetical protein